MVKRTSGASDEWCKCKYDDVYGAGRGSDYPKLVGAQLTCSRCGLPMVVLSTTSDVPGRRVIGSLGTIVRESAELRGGLSGVSVGIDHLLMAARAAGAHAVVGLQIEVREKTKGSAWAASSDQDFNSVERVFVLGTLVTLAPGS